jgi:hypothetical protein
VADASGIWKSTVQILSWYGAGTIDVVEQVAGGLEIWRLGYEKRLK